MGHFVSLLASGLSFGALISLVAIGFLFLYKATGIFNFAQGDLVTLSAYIAYWAYTTLHLPIVLAYVLALALMLVVGLVLERVAYAPLRRRPVLVVVIATLAVSIVIEGSIALWEGSSPLVLPSPTSNGSVHLLGGLISYQDILIICVTAVAVVATSWVFHHTAIGRQLRSVAFDAEMSQLCGVRTRRIAVVAFVASAGLAGLAGILIAPLTSVNITFGFNYMILAFAAAVLGGFGSIYGVVLGGLVIGLVQNVIGGYIFVNYAATLPFIVMFGVIVLRPEGFIGAPQERV